MTKRAFDKIAAGLEAALEQARTPTPFALGWAAGLAGEDPRLCPFDKMTKEWREWQSSHAKATAYMAFTALRRS